MEDPQIEIDYLRWFHQNADFGPAESDVRCFMQEEYISQGGKIPAGYEE